MINAPAPDPINPPHYKADGIEAADVIEAFDLNWRLGSVVKYILRAGRKGDRLEDLKKALWYLQREIDKSEGTEVKVTSTWRYDAVEEQAAVWPAGGTTTGLVAEAAKHIAKKAPRKR